MRRGGRSVILPGMYGPFDTLEAAGTPARAGGFGMDAPRVAAMAPGGFAAWMRARGKLGDRNKAPRVANDPALFAGLRDFAATWKG